MVTPPGPPPPTSPAFLVIALGRRVREEVDRDLAVHGLSMRHLSALGHLGREPGLSYSELARRAGVTAQSMQATLRQLEDRGAVERRTEAGRGRTAELHVTVLGDEVAARGRDAIAAADARLLGAVPADLREAFTAGLAAGFLSGTGDETVARRGNPR